MHLSSMNKCNFIFWITFFSFLLSFTGSSAFAAVPNYGLKVNYGNNQIAQNGQVDVFGSPGQTINASIMISNQSSKDHRYEVNFYTAGTTDDGSYNYTKRRRPDSSLKLNLKNYIKPVRQIVTVKANSSQNVGFNVTIPAEKFTGYLMGGIAVSPYHQKAETS